MGKIRHIYNFVRKGFRYGWFSPVVNIIGVYGGRYIPVKMMRWMSDRRHHVLEKKISEIVNIADLVSADGDNRVQPPPRHVFESAPIWYFWLQGEKNIPTVPRLCLKSIKHNAGNHPVVVITKDNIEDYVAIPKRILNLFSSGVITATHFSDILRMALLAEYGGFWMDATMFVTRPISETVFSERLFTIRQDDPCSNFVSRCRWTGFCIASKPGGLLPSLVRDIFYRYWSKEDCLIDYFFIDYAIDLAYRNSNEIRVLMDSVPVSNPNLHKLSPLLCNPYDEVEFAQLTMNTTMFKLSWKKYTDEQLLSNPKNYFVHLSRLIEE